MSRPRGHLITAYGAFAVILVMIGLTAASVPLYRLFCQVTGYGGTTQIAEDVVPGALEEKIKVRFDAGIGDELPWRFQPVDREVEVRIGEQNLAFYRAANVEDRPIVGTATFNVTPHKAGPYFPRLLVSASKNRCCSPERRSTCRCLSSSTRLFWMIRTREI